jgi:hypothetical protein
LRNFTGTVIGPIFFEIIQREGDEGFGEGHFPAPESIERGRIRRGVLYSPQRHGEHRGKEIVIASPRVRAERGPRINSAKQSCRDCRGAARLAMTAKPSRSRGVL